jgi:DNA-binding winged helix-turn-helix (wHTH) protein
MEPAQPEDRRAILAVTRRHDGRAGAELMDAWLEAAPHAFFVARSPGGGVEGFYTLIDAADTAVARLRIDTAVARFMRDIAECPLAAGQSALLLRRWLSLGEGEGPSAVQAACWLDIKRHYMERRPELRRVYMALAEFGPYAAAANTLGIAALPDRVPIGNRSMQTAMLDMGPGSVDGWLSRLAATELGVALQDCLLDKVSRALRVNGQLVALTRREFDVMAYLAARRDEAVPRDALIHDVWGLRFDAGSNVVDVVVASLRRKLGCYSGVIETMRGYGYVYRGTSMDKASARV